jgi:outer membrane protein assembly factor BamD
MSLRFLSILALSAALFGCGLLPSGEIDRTAGWSASRLYAEGKGAMGDNNWEEAIKMFQKLQTRYPYGRYAQQAQMETAYAQWKDGEPALALAACDKFIRLHPNHPNVDYVFYLKGLINFNGDLGYMGYFNTQDQTERDPKSAETAFDTFKELATRFPDSKYTPDAIARMDYLVNALAAHEVHVARYYLKRGAYVASANRIQHLLQKYPNTPSQEEGLYILMESYDKLKMPDQKRDTERVLRQNYPDSPWFTGGPKPKEKAWWQWF